MLGGGGGLENQSAMSQLSSKVDQFLSIKTHFFSPQGDNSKRFCGVWRKGQGFILID